MQTVTLQSVKDMHVEIIVLRLIHVLGGAFWVGSALFSSFFLVPALATTGPSAGAVFAALQRRRMFVVLPIVALLTILSGVRLMMIVSGGSPAYFASAMGRTLSTAATAAIVAFLSSVLIARPAAVRSAQLGVSLATAAETERAAINAELARLRKRGGVASSVSTVSLLLAAAGMAVARYLG
jgi:uncharacterized membrane protein